MTSKIESVRAIDGGARLRLTIRNEDASSETLTVLSARQSHIPHVGEIDEDQVRRLRRESMICAAITTGLRTLAAGNNSGQRLMLKMRSKGIPADIATEAVDELTQKGMLNEGRGALREAERDLKKYWGNRRILANLRQKGFNNESLAAVRNMLSEQDSVARCRALMRTRRMKLPADRADAERLFACLSRYGYTSTEIRNALSLDES